MRGCTYMGALSTGHICYPPTALTQGSPNVFINCPSPASLAPGATFAGIGGPAGRVGDLFAPHACPGTNPPPPHLIRPISQGPLNVYFNFRPPGRVGDFIACGDRIAQGSLNVFAGLFS